MKRFCKDIGIDKRTLLTMFMGGNPSNFGQGSRVDLENSNSKNDSEIKERGGTLNPPNNGNQVFSKVNTGVAAQMAYNNIIPSSIDPENPLPISQSQLMKIRTKALKSRNNNYSLTENSNQDVSLSGSLNNMGPQS